MKVCVSGKFMTTQGLFIGLSLELLPFNSFCI